MAQSSPVTLRIPLLALALLDMAVLAIRLRPWNQIVNLPGQGTTGFDPLICLAAYICLMAWISANRNLYIQQALSLGTLFSIPAGLLLIADRLLAVQPSIPFFAIRMALIAAAGILWAVAGLKGARAADHAGIGIVSGGWSAMVSALMACAVILLRPTPIASQPFAPDTWQQYETLTLGSSALHAQVHALVLVTGFLLICPLVGGSLGLIFGLRRHRESEAAGVVTRRQIP